MWQKSPRWGIGFGLMLIASYALASCGKGPLEPETDTQQAGRKPPEEIEVYSNLSAANWGTQCDLYGNLSPTKRYILDLNSYEGFHLPPKAPEMVVTDMAPLYFKADCREKLISLREIQPGSLPDEKGTWLVRPNGTFEFRIDNDIVKFRSDGNGHSDCVSYTALEFKGSLDCKDPDRPIIKLETWWNFGMGAKPAPAPSPSPSPSPGPSPVPSPRPSSRPVPVPAPGPSNRPQPQPQPAPQPQPFPFPFPFPQPGGPGRPHGLSAESPAASPVECKLPGTFFYIQTELKQCQ